MGTDNGNKTQVCKAYHLLSHSATAPPREPPRSRSPWAATLDRQAVMPLPPAPPLGEAPEKARLWTGLL